MKTILSALIITLASCLLDAQAENPDQSKSGNHTNMFSYVLTFSPATQAESAHFNAKLTNLSNKDLLVNVNDKAFHSSLEITDEDKPIVKAFIARYFTLLTTSSWSEPIVTLASQKSINWKVPLYTLFTLDGVALTHDRLIGRTVVSEMMMSVIQKTETPHSGDAVQRSKPIIIPSKSKMENKSQ